MTEPQDSPSDVARAEALVAALHPATDRFDMVVVEGDPVSKARARFARNGHAYTPKATQGAQEALAWRLRASIKVPYRSNVAVGCVFFRPNRQRIDADNMLKLVLDAATGVVWEDDSQVTAVTGVVELDVERPRTVVVFAEHESSMKRGDAALHTCEECGKKFVRNGKNAAPRFCSRECVGATATRLAPIQCELCGTSFQPNNSYRRFCSPSCKQESFRNKRRAKAAPKICEDCGKPTSKPGYKRCRACWKEARGRGISDPPAQVAA